MALTDDDRREIRAIVYDMMMLARCVDLVDKEVLAAVDSDGLRVAAMAHTKMPLRSPRRR